MNSIQQLIEEFKSDDTKKKINSLKHLPSIALSLGPERTKTELIPFLSAELLDDDDEVLSALSEALGNLSEQLGVQTYARIIFPILENLSQIPEEEVRRKTVEAFKKMFAKGNEDYFIGMIKKFFAGEFFSCKMVAIEVAGGLLGRFASNSQTEIISCCKLISKDSFPLVRAHFSLHFPLFIRVLPPSKFESEIIEISQALFEDKEDFVRINMVDNLIIIANFLTIAKHRENITNFFNLLSNDISWRVKYRIADKVGEVIQSLGKEIGRSGVMQAYVKFMQNEEPELRSISALRLDRFPLLLSQKYLDLDILIQRLLPLLLPLSKDPLPFVRSALASTVLSLCPSLGRKMTNEWIIPVFLALLNDEEVEVRVAVMNKLGELIKVIGIEAFAISVVPVLVELGGNVEWRNRVAAIQISAFFVKEMGIKLFEDEKIVKMFQSWISDRVFAVRKAIVETTFELFELLGNEWSEKNLFNYYSALIKSPNYLFRQAFLFFVQKIANKFSVEMINGQLLALLIEISKDPIANVRTNVVKALKAINDGIKDKEPVKVCLNNMTTDSDFDVKFFSKQYLESL